MLACPLIIAMRNLLCAVGGGGRGSRRGGGAGACAQCIGKAKAVKAKPRGKRESNLLNDVFGAFLHY